VQANGAMKTTAQVRIYVPQIKPELKMESKQSAAWTMGRHIATNYIGL